jgi:Cu(I)-responsive transcriptional regulator
MNIGEAGKHSGLPAKTIRYYEEIGLVRPRRQANSYRSFSEQDIHKLRFLQRARSLGFSVGDCRSLLSLYDDKSHASADIEAIALRHLNRIDDKIGELQSLRIALSTLVKVRDGDHRRDCPILKDSVDDTSSDLG